MLIEIIDDFEETFLEELVSAELESLDVELLAHDLRQLVDQELVAFELYLLVPLDTLIPGGIEEVEGGDGVGVQPQDDGQGELCEGHHQDH